MNKAQLRLIFRLAFAKAKALAQKKHSFHRGTEHRRLVNILEAVIFLEYGGKNSRFPKHFPPARLRVGREWVAKLRRPDLCGIRGVVTEAQLLEVQF